MVTLVKVRAAQECYGGVQVLLCCCCCFHDTRQDDAAELELFEGPSSVAINIDRLPDQQAQLGCENQGLGRFEGRRHNQHCLTITQE